MFAASTARDQLYTVVPGAIRWIDGRRTTITGVVLGQPGRDRIAAGLAAADAMVNRIAGQR